MLIISPSIALTAHSIDELVSPEQTIISRGMCLSYGLMKQKYEYVG